MAESSSTETDREKTMKTLADEDKPDKTLQGSILGKRLDDIPIELVGVNSNEIKLEDSNTSNVYATEGNSDDEDSNSDDEPSQTKESKSRTSAKLTPQFKGLIGEANLRFVRGDIETAQKMCFEVIRQVPNAHEPYLTLANIYENTDPVKYKSYLTIASYLNRSNSSTWSRLAEISCEEDRFKEAIHYYTKALNSSDGDINIHLKRIELAEKLGDESLARTFKTSLIKKLPVEEFEKIIQIASDIAKEFHNEKKYARALEVLEIPFRRVPLNVTQNLINMMLELLLITHQYAQGLDTFVQFCNFKFALNIGEDEAITISSFTMPENVEVDIKCKFIVFAIKLKSHEIIADLINSFLEHEEIEVVGDLYIDICEALVSENLHNIALKFYIPLTKSKNFSLAAVWLKYAECLVHCGMHEQAVDAFLTVIAMAPQHIEVLTPLGELLLSLGREEEALQVMSYHSSERLNVGILILRLKLLRKINALDEYWKCVELLLSRHCIVFKSEEEVIQFLRGSKKKAENFNKISQIRKMREDYTDLIAPFSCVNEIEPEEEMKHLRDIIEFALKQKSYDMMRKTCVMGLSSKRFEPYQDELLCLCLISCLFNKDFFIGYTIAKELFSKYPDNNYLFNLFAATTQLEEDNSVLRRFVEKGHEKYPEKGFDMLEANIDILSSFYNNGMRYYIKEFKENDSPFLSFMLGVILLQLSSQRTFARDFRTQLFETSSYLFLNYARTRSLKAAQEINFNLGRMYQHLGIMYLAEHYYKKVLEIEIPPEDEEILGLRYETAYNLHILYKHSHNMVAARKVLMEHLTI